MIKGPLRNNSRVQPDPRARAGIRCTVFGESSAFLARRDDEGLAGLSRGGETPPGTSRAVENAQIVSERAPNGTSGSVLIETLAVVVLVLAIFMVVIQVGVWMYARNVLTSAALEGARTAATDPDGPDAGVETTLRLCRTSLGARCSGFRVETADRGATVEVTVDGTIVTPGPLPALPLHVRERATDEGDIRP